MRRRKQQVRIVILGLNTAPELVGVGKFTGEMAGWLTARGHLVQVIAAPPYYPAWRLSEGWSAWRYRRETRNDVTILRCPLYVPKRLSGLRRLLHLTSFACSSLPAVAIEALRHRPDAIVTVAPTLLAVPGALLAARFSGALAWLHVQDFELDVAVDLNLLPGVLRGPAAGVERALFRSFDVVSTISGPMLERLVEKGVPEDRAVLFPNWVDTDAITPVADGAAFRHDAGIDPDAVVALYSGNIGKKQGIGVIVSAADAVRRSRRADDPEVHFVVAGAGAGRADLEKTVAIANRAGTIVKLLPLQPEERLAGMLAGADIHLLPQRAEVADLVMPSKLGGMLASGRPIVAAAAPDTQIARVVTGRGLVVPPDAAEAMAGAVLTLARDAKLRADLGAAARAAAVAEWDRATVLSRFESELEARVTAKRGDGP